MDNQTKSWNSPDGQAFGLPDGSRINGLGTFTRNGVANTFADASLAYDTADFRRAEAFAASATL